MRGAGIDVLKAEIEPENREMMVGRSMAGRPK